MDHAETLAYAAEDSSAPTSRDARHIAWLRDRLAPHEFARGIVFHTGTHCYQLNHGIEVVPICGLWG